MERERPFWTQKCGFSEAGEVLQYTRPVGSNEEALAPTVSNLGHTPDLAQDLYLSPSFKSIFKSTVYKSIFLNSWTMP